MKYNKFLNILVPIFIVIVLIIIISLIVSALKKNNVLTEEMTATVLNMENEKIVIQDIENNIYELDSIGNNIKSGDVLVIKYTGVIDKYRPDIKVISYEKSELEKDENGIPVSWNDNGIFSDYYVMAYNKLKTLTQDEKIGQLLLVRYPNDDVSMIIKKYKPSGFVFYEKDFKDKTKNEVKNMTGIIQKMSNIPLLTAVDEEGGNVVRVSSNPKLTAEKFKSPSELYKLGGFTKIKDDTIKKTNLLSNLGLNLNLAPVVDVSTNESDYIHPRTIGENTSITSEYAKTVIEASKGSDVSYTLKHFPGYGNNSDTHIGSSTDSRTYDDILKNDIPPFEAGIKAGAEAVLVSHNIVTSIDNKNPASLSPAVHNLLKNNLKFTGVIITDDISMGALTSIDNSTLKALLSGNNLVITTDYETSFNEIKKGLEDGTISESMIDQLAFKVLAWKYYKGLMLNIK